jgi:xylitol oxidase
MDVRHTNWSGNVTFSARHRHQPTSIDELRAIIAKSDKIRALGTAHSFNAIADSPADQVSLAAMPTVIDIDAQASTVTVSGGVRYGELAQHLHRAGYALHNLGSLPHISVAGACATGTHGSGVTNGNLSTAVRALEMVTANGDVVTINGTDAAFAGSVVALGMLGVVTTLTLAIAPTFEVAQYVYDDLAFGTLLDDVDAIFSAAYSVSLFTDWNASTVNQVWLKHRLPDPTAGQPPWPNARRADGPRHPVPGMPTINSTEQGGVAGAWYERLPHFKLDFTPSSGDELQTEYFVARTSAAQALAAVHGVRQLISPVLQISELRTIAADDLWLSEAYGRDSLAIHFTWINDPDRVAPVLTAVEAALAPFEARPHWGKVFSIEPAVVAASYERLPAFGALAAQYDPTGKFRNAFVDRYIARG